MTQENELERLLGRDRLEIRQMQWHILPAFESMQLARGDLPVMRPTELPVSPERRKRFKMSVSSLEKIVPAIAYREGLIDRLQPMRRGPQNKEVLFYGKTLHQADLLFNLVSQGHTGEEVRLGLPTYEPEELEPYKLATDGIHLEHGAGEADILQANLVAWEKFFKPPEPSSYNLGLAGFGVINEDEAGDIMVGQGAYELGRRFAAFWAKQVSDRGNRMWEFKRGYLTEREVGLTAIPKDINLVISTNFDFISRVEPSSKFVTTQIGDLKTGRMWDIDDLYGEILKLQAQLMLLLAEKYTVDGLGGKGELEKRGRYYILKQSAFGNLATMGRSLFTYRVIPRDTMVMDRLVVLTDRKSRDLFVKFMHWLVGKMYEHEDEIRALLSSKQEFRLAGVRLKRPFPV